MTRARRLRFVAPQHRFSPHRVQAGHTDAVVVPPPSPLSSGGSPSVPRHAAVVDTERCRVGAREDDASATAATLAVSGEQLNSLALRFAVGKRVLKRFSEP